MSLAAPKLRENESVRRHRYEAIEVDVQPIPRKRITTGEKMLWVMGIVTIFVMCLAIVGNEAAIYNGNRQVDQIQTKLDQTVSTNSGLKTQVTQLQAPERIIQFAKDKLGMTLNVNNVKDVK
jgi:cell division protein FtsL